MSDPKVDPAKVEFRCAKNPDGTYNGGAYLNAKQIVPAEKYNVFKGSCEHVKRSVEKLKKDYDGSDIQVVGDCKECFESLCENPSSCIAEPLGSLSFHDS